MTHTPDELSELLFHMIVGTVVGDDPQWRSLIGDVEELPLTMHPTGNWRVSPSGTRRERDIIDAAVKILREAHPYAFSA